MKVYVMNLENTCSWCKNEINKDDNDFIFIGRGMISGTVTLHYHTNCFKYVSWHIPPRRFQSELYYKSPFDARNLFKEENCRSCTREFNDVIDHNNYVFIGRMYGEYYFFHEDCFAYEAGEEFLPPRTKR